LKSGGDYDWGNRVSSAGYSLRYSPQTIVYHPARFTFRQVYIKTIRVRNGVFQREYEELALGQQIVRLAKIGLMPPFRKIFDTVLKREVGTALDKFKVSLLFIIFKYFVLGHCFLMICRSTINKKK
jgi:GT2 family glycosyltransferase